MMVGGQGKLFYALKKLDLIKQNILRDIIPNEGTRVHLSSENFSHILILKKVTLCFF